MNNYLFKISIYSRVCGFGHSPNRTSRVNFFQWSIDSVH